MFEGFSFFLPAYVNMHQVCVWYHGGQKKAPGMCVNYNVVLGVELGSSQKQKVLLTAVHLSSPWYGLLKGREYTDYMPLMFPWRLTTIRAGAHEVLYLLGELLENSVYSEYL